ncbi:MAG: sigma-54-dependent Fis family transcriptional regulator [Planctomycetes bacterium]|nr:sigma-54-dependent Fis family transcriptional regulator [Planctomycetota bacterium]
MTTKILIVDDDRAHAETCAEALEPMGMEIVVANTGAEGLDRVRASSPFGVVLTDLVMRDHDGFEVLEAVKEKDPSTTVLMLTGHGNRDVAVRAMEEGALYYLEKPVDLDELRTKVRKALETHDRNIEYDALKRDISRVTGLSEIIGRAPQIVRLVELINQVAPTQASVLIRGESGTGKELVARAIHALSPRRHRPFVALNCGGLSEGTIESELFGHVKGAFTGAMGDRAGKFEFAKGGTLFLDEVAEMPVQTQVKLLRVLEDRMVVPVGANDSIPVDVRVLAATHQDLEKRIESGEFREDLYYRLKVITLNVPPLRERRQDIPLLAEHFRKQLATLHDKHVDGIDREVLVAFSLYDWPGNVRELRNVIESMVVRARGNILTVLDLPPELSPSPRSDNDPWSFLAGKNAAEVERQHLRVTLDMFHGNRQRAAQTMGISERTLYRRIKDYGLGDEGGSE